MIIAAVTILTHRDRSIGVTSDLSHLLHGKLNAYDYRRVRDEEITRASIFASLPARRTVPLSNFADQRL